MYRKLIGVVTLVLACLGLLSGTANARWAEFSYTNLPGDTLSADLGINSAKFDSLVPLSGPIFSMELGVSWNPQAIALDTVIFGGITSPWGDMIYSVDTILGKCLLAGAGVSNIADYGRILTARFNYLGATVWDSTKQWLTLFRERYNEYSDVQEQPPLLPGKFTLRQNYPNPFNPATTIEFHLAHAGSATLSVYNLLGQKVKRVAFGQIAASEHHYIWDGTNDYNEPVASGMYLYKLETAHGSQTKKMMLTK